MPLRSETSFLKKASLDANPSYSNLFTEGKVDTILNDKPKKTGASGSSMSDKHKFPPKSSRNYNQLKS